MKVKELIALLEQQPQDKKIEFYDDIENKFLTLDAIEQATSETGKVTQIFLNFVY
jgi:hypothetical protein